MTKQSNCSEPRRVVAQVTTIGPYEALVYPNDAEWDYVLLRDGEEEWHDGGFGSEAAALEDAQEVAQRWIREEAEGDLEE